MMLSALIFIMCSCGSERQLGSFGSMRNIAPLEGAYEKRHDWNSDDDAVNVEFVLHHKNNRKNTLYALTVTVDGRADTYVYFNVDGSINIINDGLVFVPELNGNAKVKWVTLKSKAYDFPYEFLFEKSTVNVKHLVDGDE